MAKILVINDEVTVQVVLQNLLEREGYQVAIAIESQDGLDQAQTLHPDVIISDWMTPQINGLEICRQIKADPALATTFFMLLTAREGFEDRSQGFAAGVDDFLFKPIEAQDVLARVRLGLRVQELTQQRDRDRQDLQQIQSQLVHSEKMASLGVLVQGIAHEINNPITFIYSNLTHVQNYASDLIDLLSLYQKQSETIGPDILQKQQEMELDFVLSDLFKILTSMRTGSDRIRQIILSLQEFSRTDRSGWQPFDINASLDNTLLMLQNRLPAREGRSDIKIIKEYGELPLVECYAGQLNQAFLNILNNAIDALDALELNSLEDFETDQLKPTIEIITQVLDPNHVLIQITDNGVGMNEAVKAQIFEPFFTTKALDEASGLGLPISYQIIVHQHQGHLNCCSEPGKGTEFSIEIPIRHN